MPSKEEQEQASSAVLEAPERNDDQLPLYSAIPSSQGPTAQSPFDFPSGPPPPPILGSASSSASAPIKDRRPIAIPQIAPDKTKPFLDAYAQPLLQYGITPESWRAFVATMSAFLAAKVSEKAVAHAADIGRHMTNVPKRFGQDTLGHAKSVGSDIRDSAKSGNYLGAAMGVVGGAISLPVGTAFRAAGAVISLPGTAIGAAVQKPRTPRERAAAYAAAANEKWLGVRGLRVQLLDTAELASIAGLSVTGLLDVTRASEDRSAAGQLNTLKGYFSGLETFTGSALDLGANTLWLVGFQEGDTAPVADVRGDGMQ